MTIQRRTRRDVLRAIGTAGIAASTGTIPGCTGRGTDRGNGPGAATIFHAGSLAPPFSEAEPVFEGETGINVNREAKGSVASTKKVTQQGRSADVLAVSDFRLIRDNLLPEYGKWYSIFATNAMTIAYTGGSTGADEIGTDNWWEILARDDVKFAHSDPAMDPNGYRTVMTMQLGATPFDGETLYGQETYEKLREKELVPSGTESTLISQLHSGKIDYTWEYASAGASHDVKTVELQPQVDLSKATPRYAEHYAKAEVETDSGTFTGAPIAYGITVPKVAQSPENGARWVEHMLTEPGRKVLKDNGFAPVETPVVPKAGEDAVPGNLSRYVEARDTLGPMEL